MFGYKRGAFRRGKFDRDGKIQQAHGGQFFDGSGTHTARAGGFASHESKQFAARRQSKLR
jgi:hypothetical protein